MKKTLFWAEGFDQLYQIICPCILRSLKDIVPNVGKGAPEQLSLHPS